MIFQVFSVFDKAVNAYLPPFFVRSKGEAVRSFTEVVNDNGKPFGKYALDYTLVELGTFDDSSGLFSTGDPVRVIGASQVLNEEVLPPSRP